MTIAPAGSADASERMRPITVRIPEACRIRGIGRSKTYEFIQSGDITTFKIGTITLIPVASIEDFLAPAGES